MRPSLPLEEPMPVVTLAKPRVAAPKPAVKPYQSRAALERAKTDRDSAVLKIATELSKPIQFIEEATWLIYGSVKIGKTTLLSQFKRPYFLFFEPGGNAISLMKSDLPSWKKLVEPGGVRDQLLDSPHRTIVIDTADRAYKFCYDFVCKRERFTHPNDLKWGEGWIHINKEFEDLCDSFSKNGKTLVFTSHAKDKEFQSRRTGSAALMEEYSKIVPSMTGSCRSFVEGFVDVFAFYGYFGADRYLCIRDGEDYEAGTRLKHNFRTTSGKQVRAIPMHPTVSGADYDEEDAYKALVKAFNNQQTATGEPTGTVRLSNIALKPQVKTRR